LTLPEILKTLQISGIVLQLLLLAGSALTKAAPRAAIVDLRAVFHCIMFDFRV